MVRKKIVNISLLQFKVDQDKEKNFKTLEKFLKKANKNFKPDFVSLPEMWNTPYSKKFFIKNKEDINGKSIAFLKSMAKKYKVNIIGGSVPYIKDTKKESKIFNTCFFISSTGRILGEYSKKHLFDINIKGKTKKDSYSFFESDTLTKGKNNLIVDTKFGRIAVLICFDIRFINEFNLLKNKKVDLIFIPANFNTLTGPKHFELLGRSRALDTQSYVFLNASARSYDGHFLSYANSMAIGPSGNVLKRLDEKEGVINISVDLSLLKKERESIPIS